MSAQVPSVEASSTSRISLGGAVWSRAEATARSRCCSALYAGTRTETSDTAGVPQRGELLLPSAVLHGCCFVRAGDSLVVRRKGLPQGGRDRVGGVVAEVGAREGRAQCGGVGRNERDAG